MQFLDYQDLVIGLSVKQWLGLALALPAAYLAGFVLERLLVSIGGLLARRCATEWDDEFVRLLPGPARLALSLLIFLALAQALTLPDRTVAPILQMVVRSGLIISAVWFASRFVDVASRFLETRLTRRLTDELSRRAVQTQIAVPREVLRFLLVAVGIALVLWQFPVVQSLGAGMLGVAGIAAAAATLSTQRSLSNIFAGLQIAIAQPVKIGDTVVVEGEMGTIEQITVTYVVVKTWDWRRLVLPMTYLLDKPIQNLTKGSTKLLGTVILHIDYSISVDDVRAELDRILGETDLWNGEAKSLAVTELSQNSAELRALLSADDAGKLWDLRCLVREKLFVWLQSRKKKS